MLEQNFSIPAGNSATLDVDVETTISGDTLAGATLYWRVYEQNYAVPIPSPVVIEKTSLSGGGLTILPSPMQFSISLEAGDTMSLLGNYYHEATLTDGTGAVITLFFGIMTVKLTENAV